MTDLCPNESCLHLVVTRSETGLSDCMSQFVEGDSIVFLDAGVLHLCGQAGHVVPSNRPGVCFSLEDLMARGLLETARQKGVQIEDDRAVASLLFKHSHCLTWT